jgi:hypothetical protein
LVVLLSVATAGCGTYSPSVMATAADGRGAIRPLAAPLDCTSTVTDADGMRRALSTAAPGNRICVFGDINSTRLVITNSGTIGQPIQILGDGRTIVRGITVKASNIIVSGINAVQPVAPGISLAGQNITLENDASINPRGGDGDGIRFWGTNITIRHNTIRNTHNLHGAHADCMQTFATGPDAPASQHVLIENNRCEQIDNMCLIAEGPNSLAGDGSGVGATTDITFNNNYCDDRKASQALQIDDVQNLAVTNNTIAGPINHAFAFQNMTTGAKVIGNTLNPLISYAVGMDESSQEGYLGPQPGGRP